MQTPTWHEQAVVFDCEGCRLIGIVTQPETQSEHGVVIVVGGPQYRAGSHRQFTLLARYLAEQGIPSLRFDYRGMGDSEGEMRNFESIDADVNAAIETLMSHVPGIHRIALWGLCDAASAALYYAQTDPRVSHLILLNPWVHTQASATRARLKHYYLSRLLQRSFWSKFLSGKMNWRESSLDFSKSAQSLVSAPNSNTATVTDPRHGSADYINRMLNGLQSFKGELLFILSGNDLTAQEFITLTREDPQWKKIYHSSAITEKIVHKANHTFACQSWRREVETRTALWIANTR